MFSRLSYAASYLNPFSYSMKKSEAEKPQNGNGSHLDVNESECGFLVVSEADIQEAPADIQESPLSSLQLIHSLKLDNKAKDFLRMVIDKLASCLSGQNRELRVETVQVLASLVVRQLKLESMPDLDAKVVIQDMARFLIVGDGKGFSIDKNADELKKHLGVEFVAGEAVRDREHIGFVVRWSRLIEKLNANGNFIGADFSAMDLSGLDFSNLNMNHSSFISAILTGTQFDGCSMSYANFSNLGISEADLKLHVKKMNHTKF